MSIKKAVSALKVSSKGELTFAVHTSQHILANEYEFVESHFGAWVLDPTHKAALIEVIKAELKDTDSYVSDYDIEEAIKRTVNWMVTPDDVLSFNNDDEALAGKAQYQARKAVKADNKKPTVAAAIKTTSAMLIRKFSKDAIKQLIVLLQASLDA